MFTANAILAFYAIFFVGIITAVVGSNYQGFRAVVIGFADSVLIAFNIFRKNTMKFGGEVVVTNARHENHEMLAASIKRCGDQLDESITAVKWWFSNKWAILVDGVKSIHQGVVASLGKFKASVAKSIAEKREALSNLFASKEEVVEEEEEVTDEDIIGTIELASEFTWLQRLLGIDKICARLDSQQEELENIKAALAGETSETVEIPETPSIVIDEEYMETVRKVTREGAANVLSVDMVIALEYKDLRHLAVVYGVLKGRKTKGMPKQIDLQMMVGQAIDRAGHWGRDICEVALEMEQAA